MTTSYQVDPLLWARLRWRDVIPLVKTVRCVAACMSVRCVHLGHKIIRSKVCRRWRRRGRIKLSQQIWPPLVCNIVTLVSCRTLYYVIVSCRTCVHSVCGTAWLHHWECPNSWTAHASCWTSSSGASHLQRGWSGGVWWEDTFNVCAWEGAWQGIFIVYTN